MTPLPAVTILVIEDDEQIRQALAEMLELNNFHVVVAPNGTEGLRLARCERPAIVMTDINMPGLTGFELLEAFRGDETLRGIPVIVITARVDRETTRRGMELGAADFITKPFSEPEVLHSIAARLEKKELLDELDSFSHTVAHDLKNPLTTLLGRIDLLGLLLDSADKATLRHQVDEARKSGRRLNTIINELLVLAGVRRQTVALRPLEMALIVAEAIEQLDSLLEKHEVKIAQPAVWPAALGHGPWVIHLWANYLSNAAKYGGPAPRITLGAALNADGRHVRFWVEDDGPGLDEAEQARMFVPFARISDARVKGNGLGLSIVRRIAEKLGGNVGVVSRPGSGARFWFELPADHPPAANSALILP
jgi:two-component system sensor histidine kinase/response regulator